LESTSGLAGHHAAAKRCRTAWVSRRPFPADRSTIRRLEWELAATVVRHFQKQGITRAAEACKHRRAEIAAQKGSTITAAAVRRGASGNIDGRLLPRPASSRAMERDIPNLEVRETA